MKWVWGARLECQVLQLRLDAPHAEAVGERRKHVQRLAGGGGRGAGGQRGHAAHVLQPVGQLDKHRARVRHRQQHRRQPLRELRLGPPAARLQRVAVHLRAARRVGARRLERAP